MRKIASIKAPYACMRYSLYEDFLNKSISPKHKLNLYCFSKVAKVNAYPNCSVIIKQYDLFFLLCDVMRECVISGSYYTGHINHFRVLHSLFCELLRQFFFNKFISLRHFYKYLTHCISE